MKKLFISMAIFLAFMTSCGKSSNEGVSESIEPSENATETIPSETTTPTVNGEWTNETADVIGDYIDLTTMNSTMVYSTVYDMTVKPENYVGKTVKATGAFGTYTDIETQKKYFAVMVEDAAACCAQGIEFVWKGEHSYPEDYPELGTTITVEGVFNTYVENDVTYFSLYDASMEIN